MMWIAVYLRKDELQKLGSKIYIVHSANKVVRVEIVVLLLYIRHVLV